jgi:hypothetical protein
MLDRYDYEIEDVIIDDNKEIVKLKKELKQTKKKLEYVKKYIDANCIYDEHLDGYCLDLPASKVRTLMYKIKE